MHLSPNPLRSLLTALREFRLDIKIRRWRYEIARFPGQEIRLQWVTDPDTGHLHGWYGPWTVTIYKLKPLRLVETSGQGV